MATEVKFKRKLNIDSLPIENGSVVFDMTNKEIFIDEENKREKYTRNQKVNEIYNFTLGENGGFFNERNFFNPSKILLDKYTEQGEIKTYAGWNCSDLIPVSENEKYCCRTFINGKYVDFINLYADFFDKNKKFIGFFHGASTSEKYLQNYTLPKNTAYIRLSQAKEYINENTVFGIYKFINSLTNFLEYNKTGLEQKVEENSFLLKDIGFIKDSVSNRDFLQLTQQDGIIYKVSNNKITTVQAPNFKVAETECTPNKKYYYSGAHYNYSNQYSIIVTDKENNVLFKALGDTSNETSLKNEKNYEFITPKNSSKIYIQSYGTQELKLATDIINTKLAEEVKNLKTDIIKYNQPNYDKICRSICRLGYNPYSSSTPPEQSIESYKLAYKNGFRILLCDLQFTKDKIPVLWHDEYLNQYGSQVYKDGVLVDKKTQLYIKNMTYQELLTYDFGVYKGTKYKDTKIMTLNQMCSLCKKLGVELYIEIKGMSTQEEAEIACNVVSMYGLKNLTSWCGNTNQLKYVLQYHNNARVATMPSILDEGAFSALLSLKGNTNKLFFFSWYNTQLTTELVKRMVSEGIEFEQGNIDTAQQVFDYFDKGEPYSYCTGINTGSVIIGKVLLEKEMNS